MRKTETDVIVVTTGPSGLAVCISATENGARVLVFEKFSTTGGAANMGTGPLGVGSRIQREHMISFTPGEALRKHMYFTHCRVNVRMVHDYYFRSGDTTNWLLDMGVEFAGVQRALGTPENIGAYSDGEFIWHVCKPEDGGIFGPKAAASMTEKMTERTKDLGVGFLLETLVCKVIMEDDRAVGVMAKDKDGEKIKARAQSVIFVIGGFDDNPVMIKGETGYELGKTIFNFAIPGMKGDGIRMAREAGTGKESCIMELMYQFPDNMNRFIPDGAFCQPCLWVNRNEQKFMSGDRIGNTVSTGNVAVVQPGNVAYSIFDSKLLKKYRKEGPDIVSHVHLHDLYDHSDKQWNRDLADGYEPTVRADTIEELAERTDIDTEGLAVQVEEYNEMCKAGSDEIFEKDRHYMQPIAKAPLYCRRQNVGAYGSLGGVRINHKTEVMTQEAGVIPGLHCVGTDTYSILGDNYPFILSDNAMGFYLSNGRITGENVAAGLDEFEYQRIQTAESEAEE